MIPQVTAAALGQREQEPRLPGQRRFHPDFGRPGRPCLDGPDRRAQGRARSRATPPASIAVELIAAAQGVDFHAPLKTSATLQDVHAKVRAISSHFTADRYWADDMAALQAAVLAGEFGTFEAA